MKSVDGFDFSGKRALVRVDFNVPLDKETSELVDDTRIRAVMPTIRKILNDGGSLVLMSHLGRPQKKRKSDGSIDFEKHSLKHLVNRISELTGRDVKFAADCISEDAFNKSASLKPGEVLLLENLRFYKEEEMGETEFAGKLARHGELFINDAFGTAHRAHASTAVVAKFFKDKRMFGYLMAGEIRNADRVMNHAERPFTAIMGGAKVSDKILILGQLMEKVDHLVIGGGMAYTFLKSMGGGVGSSLCEDDKLELARKILEKASHCNVQLHLPQDSVIADRFNAMASTQVMPSNQIPDGWMGLDIGPEASASFAGIINQSRTILWNGPMGVFEMKPFSNGTKQVAKSIVDATGNGAFSLIGGGDSAAAINKFGLADKVSYVSTGGGALLEYFEGKDLPGIKMVMD